MKPLQIDINCDLGESYGRFKVGNDKNVFPYLTSCNIACGFHGGDPLHMEETIQLALRYGVKIGAHPSYPDLGGFGRRRMHIQPNELRAIIKYQIAALKGMVESFGGRLSYVKPHGALYNAAANEEQETITIIRAVQEIDANLILMGLAGSMTEQVAAKEGIPFVAEAFADRRYTAAGRLLSRALDGSVIHDPEQAARQVLSIAMEQSVESHTGESVPVKAQSICIHGDNPSAIAILEAIDEALGANDIIKKSFAV